ncbi:hypothetical protein DLAC_11493 [Tieghemostelium lacteum]|uniref:Uncharacterized protein n=1 Tax=Tieghemostelium lacteum TaxID=361077 RepID=A0A152A6A1_TIELA|nr:hypothetical protein DLAC_11493 [Tieghemostelium lacteum]|eukprot:KYR01750.1 hypothetical protein DLAC_11493 [Tieghemostelium lacteum]
MLENSNNSSQSKLIIMDSGGGDGGGGISPPLSPCFQLLGSPAPPCTPSIPSPPTLFLSTSSNHQFLRREALLNVMNQNSGMLVLDPTNSGSSTGNGGSIESNNTTTTTTTSSGSVNSVNSNTESESNSNSQMTTNNNISIIETLLSTPSSGSIGSQSNQPPISLLLSSSSIHTQETPTNTNTIHLNSALSSSIQVPIPPLSPPCSQDNSNDHNNNNITNNNKKIKILETEKTTIENINPIIIDNNNTTTSTTTNNTQSSNSKKRPLEEDIQYSISNGSNSSNNVNQDYQLDRDYLHVKRQHQQQLKNHSLSQQLMNREMYRPKPNTSSLQSRKFYLNIVPDKTVYNIEIPNCIIKKFTSDGEMLLCFTKDLKEIQLYRFLGANHLHNSTVNLQPQPTRDQMDQMERRFENYFSLIYQSHIPTSFHEYLNRDFSLTTLCGRYFILASSGPTTSTSNLNNNSNLNHSNNSSMPQIQSLKLPNCEDITFYLVSIKDGVVRDRIHFKKDVIHLAHHSGVYLYKNLFIVLSLQYQIIHIYQIKDSNFVPLKSVGPYCNDDDQIEIELQDRKEAPFAQQVFEKQSLKKSYSNITPLMKSQQRDQMKISMESFNLSNSTNNININSSTNSNSSSNSIPPLSSSSSNIQQPQQPSTTTTSNNNNNNNSTNTNTSQQQSQQNNILFGIKQRFLSYLFKKAYTSKDSKKALSLYYSLFQQYSNLVMWKMQSLDAQHLLIKFGTIEGLMGRFTDFCNQICFFVVYNIETSEIIGVYENSNKEFANTFEQFCEHFRACSCPSGLIKFRSTCSNNSYVREHLVKQKLAVVNARYGGETQAVKRILSALPFSPQSWNESPYFDKYLFSYDEKIISSTERPKPLVELPIKFYSRVSGEVKFKLNTGSMDKQDRQSKKYATYIFHPYYPFIISLQHSSSLSPVSVNFHFIGDGHDDDSDSSVKKPTGPPLSSSLNSSISNNNNNNLLGD